MIIASSKNVTSSRGPNSIDSKVRLVSVIIPTYNHAHYLSEAIRSVLLQTYGNYEIVVVDDGSTDNTGEVVAEFGDQVRYIWQENGGLSAARNTGLRAAGGDFIGLLDADDMYESEFLETLIDILQSDPDIDGVYCSAQAVDVGNNPLPQKIGKSVPTEQFRDTLLKGGFFPPLCMFAHTYCYEELGLFDGSFQGSADWDMWLRMSDRYNIVGTDRILARYRIVPNSMSRDPNHMLDDRTRVLRKYYADETDDNSNWTRDHRQALAYSYLRATIEFLQAGDLDEGYRNLNRAFISYPELSTDYEVFYMLSLGSQPMGFRTDYESLETDVNASVLMAMIDELFSDPEMAVKIGQYRRAAYGNAYLALATLSYGSRRFGESRRFLLQAVSIEPRFAFKHHTISTLVKSFLGVTAVEKFKRLRQRKSIQGKDSNLVH